MMARKKKKTPSENFYVSINNPSEVRVQLLESRKSILESMKLFQSIKHIRKEKDEQKKGLKKDLRNISRLMNKIKSEMPKVNLTQSTKNTKKITKKPQKKGPKKKEHKHHHKTELERIEAELKEVESKLSGL